MESVHYGFIRNLASNQLYRIFQALDKDEDKIQMIKELERLDILIELADRELQIYSLCNHADLNSFWQELLRHPVLLKEKIIYCSSTTKFLSQPFIKDFDLISGIYFYGKHFALESGKEKYLNPADLIKSEKYNFFMAISLLNKNDTNQIMDAVNNNKNYSISLQSIFNRAENAAKTHGTPGYILLAYTSLCLAKYNKCVLKTDADMISAAYQQALTYMKTAKLLENDCQVSIHNAYFGRGVVTSNTENRNLDDLVQWCIEAAGPFLNGNTISIAERQANIFANTFIKNLKMDSSQSHYSYS